MSLLLILALFSANVPFLCPLKVSGGLGFWRFAGVWLGNGDRALGCVGLGAVGFLGGVVSGIGAVVIFVGCHISHYAVTRAGSGWP